MDFPEGLWWRHSSKKQGLIPRMALFESGSNSAATTFTEDGITNVEREYDLLVTHCSVLAKTDLNGVRYCSIDLIDPYFPFNAVKLWRKSTSSASNFQLAGMIERPIFVRAGGKLLASATFLSADASNSLEISGFGFYIPRLEI